MVNKTKPINGFFFKRVGPMGARQKVVIVPKECGIEVGDWVMIEKVNYERIKDEMRKDEELNNQNGEHKDGGAGQQS